MKRKNLTKHFLRKVGLCLIAASLLSSCGKQTDNGGDALIKSIPEADPQSGTKSYEGTWYNQSVNETVLTIRGSEITYDGYGYSETSKFKTKKSSGQIQILPEDELFIYVDIFYDPDADVLTAHTMPHMDGDGGYHLLTFARSEYVAPPPPVYGDRADQSDPDAVKEFKDYSLKHLTFSVHEPRRDYGDMAEQPPREGDYAYELIVNEDRSAMLASDFCQSVAVTEDRLKEIEDYLQNNKFALMNGVDIWTEDMPESTEWFELDIEFSNGETLHARANGPDLPLEWTAYGREFHVLLFYSFVDAGYNIWTNEFHSTAAMKRYGRAPESRDPEYTVEWSPVHIEKKGEAYDYRVYSEYPAVTCEGTVPEFEKTLNDLCGSFKEHSEADLEEMYADMAAVPKSVWKKTDRLTAYSFYSRNARYAPDDLLYPLWIDEGHSYPFDIGEYGYGYYPDYRFAVDPKTGQILTVEDLFNDKAGFKSKLIDEFCGRFGYDDARSCFEAEDYQKKLDQAISVTELDGGIGFEAQSDGLHLFMPAELSYSGDYSFDLILYYDEIQDIMEDKYCDIW